MFAISYFSAFLGGMLTFFAPCTLPLMPAFIAFIGGSTKGQSQDKKKIFNQIFFSAASFVLGFTIVFIFFGLVSGTLGSFFVLHKKLISQVGGIVVILLGLSMLHAIRLPIPSFLRGARVPKFITPGSCGGGFVLGLLFALGWSPCLGPVLGTILILAGASGSAVIGMKLLFVYALGLALPFMVVAIFYGTAVGYVVALQKHLHTISQVGGVLIICMGILLLFGQFGDLTSVFFDVYATPQFQHLMDFM